MQIIAHLDMDAFFAACEERANPEFRGLGIVVGADPKNGLGRGVVSTANYQARKYGIHSAMPITTAWRLSQVALKRGEPKTVFLPVNGSYYSQVSEKIFAIVRKYVRVVEQTSIDEAYLDLTPSGSNKIFLGDVRRPLSRSSSLPSSSLNEGLPSDDLGNSKVSKRQVFKAPRETYSSPDNIFDEAIQIIQQIKAEIKSQEQLTAKVGIGPNKLIAKMASARSKPDGLVVVTPKEAEKFLEPLAIGDIPGVGPKSEEFFHKKKIYKIADLKKISKEQLQSWMGKWGSDIYDKARGIDDSEVTEEREIKSISEQETFEKDTLSAAFILDRLDKLSGRVLERMKDEAITAFKTITIVVRFADFVTYTRSHTLKNYTGSLPAFKNEAIKLLLPFLDRRENPNLKKIRLIGAGIESFPGEEKEEKKELPKPQISQSRLF